MNRALATSFGCCLLALAACSGRESPGSSSASSASGIHLKGQLATRDAVELPPGSWAVVELRGSEPPDGVVAEQRIGLGGRGFPVPFELAVASDTAAGHGALELRGVIYSDHLPAWSSDEVSVDPAAPAADLGALELHRVDAEVKTTRWQCGDRTVTVDFAAGAARLAAAGKRFALRQVPTASGARYEAIGGTSTWIWNKGQQTTVVVGGEEYGECSAIDAAADAFRARGNEPGWRLEIGTTTMTLVTDYGAQKVSVATPSAAAVDGGTRFVVQTEEGPLTATVLDRVCADDMSGMPYPKSVIVEFQGKALRGCGGEPVELLEGEEWIVDEIAGQPVPAGTRVTIRFDAAGRAGGQGPCNGYGAGYELTGESLTFGKSMSTMRACEPPLMQLEDAFHATLSEVRHFAIDDGSLVLSTPAGTAIRAHRP